MVLKAAWRAALPVDNRRRIGLGRSLPITAFF
jgi:hypothetical protein